MTNPLDVVFVKMITLSSITKGKLRFVVIIRRSCPVVSDSETNDVLVAEGDVLSGVGADWISGWV